MKIHFLWAALLLQSACIAFLWYQQVRNSKEIEYANALIANHGEQLDDRGASSDRLKRSLRALGYELDRHGISWEPPAY